ncbi:MAG: hypothetical protein IJY62_03940 [Clostridia bacterium]|nr:hypothetical protein [Clostridia bacterium]
MRICFVTRGTLNSFWERYGGSDADILFFSFQGAGGEVNYEKELKGETSRFEDVAILSRENKNIVVCGCVTDTRGIRRKSAVVAENGRILGVSDMLNSIDGEYSSGAGLRVYETKLGRLGIAVAEDIYFPEILRTLAVCGSDLVLCPFGNVRDTTESTLLRAAAFSYGLPICLCANGYGMVADITGELAFSSPHSPVEFSFEKKKEYHLVENRRRGFFKPERTDF